jgi:hypothetical protein
MYRTSYGERVGKRGAICWVRMQLNFKPVILEKESVQIYVWYDAFGTFQHRISAMGV